MKIKINKNFNIYVAVVLLIIVPITFIFTIFRGTMSIMESWQAFVDLCTSISINFMNYYVTHTNLGLLTALLIFSLGGLSGFLFLLGQIKKSAILGKEFKRKSIASKQLNELNNYVHAVKDDRLFALTVGFFKPTIYISSGLQGKLSEDELNSVIAHEQFHQKYYHPLVLLCINTLRRSLFFFPFLQDIVKYINLKLEIAADEEAIFITSRKILASAFVKVADDRNNLDYFIVSTPRFSSTSERISFIGRNKKPSLKFSRRLVSFSIGAVFILNVFLVGPLSRDVHAQETAGLNDLITAQVISDCLGENAIITWVPANNNQTELNMSISTMLKKN